MKLTNQYKLRKRRGRHGGVAMEAALILPVLVIILIGTIDVGQYVNVAQTVSNASREGVRLACRRTTESIDDVEEGVEAYLSNVFPQLSDDQLDGAVTVIVRLEKDNNIQEGNLNTVKSGDPLSVEVAIDYGHIRWMKGVSVWLGEYNRSTSVGRRE